MVEVAERCPGCLGAKDLRGLIYTYGSAIGRVCQHPWHDNANPDVLVLTDSDKQFMQDLRIAL